MRAGDMFLLFTSEETVEAGESTNQTNHNVISLVCTRNHPEP